jgi:integrase
MRRGEILALRWSDLDAELTTAHVRRTLETAGGRLVFEEPKTRRSRRAVSLPAFLRPYLVTVRPGYGREVPNLRAKVHRAKARSLLRCDSSVRAELFRRRLCDCSGSRGRSPPRTGASKPWSWRPGRA